MTGSKRTSLSQVLLLSLSALAAPAQGAAASPPEADIESVQPPLALDERIDAALSAQFLADASVSVHVVDLETGKVLYAKDADKALNPASNVKLFTTAAALMLLGPEHRYTTQAWAKADAVQDGVLRGPIYLEGSGDPALVTGDLYELALRVRATGITKITGGIVVDAERFDRDGLPPGFDQKDEFASYRAPGGATSVNFNTYEVLVHPGSTVGTPAVASISPAVPSIKLVNRTTTAEGRRNRITVAVDDKSGGTTVTVSGTMGLDGARAAYRYPVSDPSRYAGEVFAVVLRQAGIRLERRTVKSGSTPAGADRLGIHRSPTLGVLARSVNKLSNNFMAEQILRTLAEGDGASADASLERLRAWTRDLGVAQRDLHLGNGSGLYDNNRISAAQMTHVLASMYGDFRYRPDYLASLAVMGVDGTTRKRLRESEARGWIRAKTGTLDGVSALSGYAGAVGRRPVAFSILMNDLGRWETGAARGVQNEIAQMLTVEITASSE